jgi:hypothetical protein
MARVQKVIRHTKRARSGPSRPEARGMSLSPTEAADQLFTIVVEPDHSARRRKLSPSDLQKYSSSDASRRKIKRRG